jgi:transposase-like protein
MPMRKDNSDELIQENETIDKLEKMLAAVLHYLSDDEIEEIDIEYLLANTENLRDWWKNYQEKNKKKIEDEIKASLNMLSFEELENIREQIKKKKD